jgi:Kef-type K+ transport system membrane component KefB
MSGTEIFLLAMMIIFSFPWIVWRWGHLDNDVPLVVVQILSGIILGPGLLGRICPSYYQLIFTPSTIQSLNGIAWWAVMVFVWLAGIELDLKESWGNRKETLITASLALITPMAGGAFLAYFLSTSSGWIGDQAQSWQFILGVGMSCAVTALPILVLFLEKLSLLRQPLGQRILRYASMDDIIIWGVLALILMDWDRIALQLTFFLLFLPITAFLRYFMAKMSMNDRWYGGLIWLIFCALGADWSGLHFMVGAFLSGAVIDKSWFDEKKLDDFRHHVLFIIMPVFFLSTGLRTNWSLGGSTVFTVAFLLLIISIIGKLLGLTLAGKLLKWPKGEASLIGWLLQTKGLIIIIFSNILLDRHIITDSTYTALLLMAVGSTSLTIPAVRRLIKLN